MDDLLEFGIINVSFNKDKKIVGIEVLYANKHIPKEILEKAD